jgi:hypothetical protein
VGEVKGEGTGGCVSLSLGVRGLCPWENLKKKQMHAGELKRIFQTKINTLIPAFIPVNCGKVSNPFET